MDSCFHVSKTTAHSPLHQLTLLLVDAFFTTQGCEVGWVTSSNVSTKCSSSPEAQEDKTPLGTLLHLPYTSCQSSQGTALLEKGLYHDWMQNSFLVWVILQAFTQMRRVSSPASVWTCFAYKGLKASLYVQHSLHCRCFIPEPDRHSRISLLSVSTLSLQDRNCPWGYRH